MDAAAHRWVLPSDLTAVGLARQYVVEVCGGLPTEKVDVARLLASELVANAFRHAFGSVVLDVACDGAHVRVEVDDESYELPVIAEWQPLMERGSGLRIVAALATSWGAGPRLDGMPGKSVWFSLD